MPRCQRGPAQVPDQGSTAIAAARLVDRFPCGEVQFDAFSNLGIRKRVIDPVVRRSGWELLVVLLAR